MHKKRSAVVHGVFLYSAFCVLFIVFQATAQDKIQDNTFKRYTRGYFKPKRPLQYDLYLSPLLTVDPLGLGGRSTYALGAGSRINLWESKSADGQLQGLRVKGLYTAFGYEWFPQQSDNLYASLWLRVKTFMPIAARLDYVYSYGNGLRGTSYRYCFGFEVKNVSVLLAGTITRFISPVLGDHPYLDSPYANAGSVMLIIPVYNHYPPVR